MATYLILARAVRIELTLTVLETAVLPLYDARVSQLTYHSKIRPKAEEMLFAFVVNIILTAKATVL